MVIPTWTGPTAPATICMLMSGTERRLAAFDGLGAAVVVVFVGAAFVGVLVAVTVGSDFGFGSSPKRIWCATVPVLTPPTRLTATIVRGYLQLHDRLLARAPLECPSLKEIGGDQKLSTSTPNFSRMNIRAVWMRALTVPTGVCVRSATSS